ncbi:hexitol phosphatase HxpB [Corallincola platygyrae]|uniref:Hexitol phosphatase HxpB n=1 Tax=Corallincola platygyrae TaxID=1193278 RepID=A0ABW4XMT9_9GAMM
MNEIKAVIFDMDGVIVDSEPLWRMAESKVFNDFGIPITEEMCFQTTGLRIDEVVNYWRQRYEFSAPNADVENAIMDQVITEIQTQSEPMPGAVELITALNQSEIPLAVCSSSPSILIETVLERFSISEKFQTFASAEHLNFGKPHPEVYLKGAQQLGLKPQHCLAIEDSVNGVIAAKAARMTAVAIPESSEYERKAFGVADGKYRSLVELHHHMTTWLPQLKAE